MSLPPTRPIHNRPDLLVLAPHDLREPDRVSVMLLPVEVPDARIPGLKDADHASLIDGERLAEFLALGTGDEFMVGLVRRLLALDPRAREEARRVLTVRGQAVRG